MGCSNGGVWAYLLRPAGHNNRASKKRQYNRRSKELRGKVKSSVDEKTTGELRWEKPDARKGKEITEEYGKHNRTGNGENINRSTILSRRGTIAKRRNQRWGQIEAIMWENEEEENRTQGRGKETE